MKDEQISESTSFRICDRCHANFVLPPSYSQDLCEKCYNGQGTPKFSEEVLVIDNLDLEGVSPRELVQKLRKTNSVNFERSSVEGNSREEEAAANSNLAS